MSRVIRKAVCGAMKREKSNRSCGCFSILTLALTLLALTLMLGTAFARYYAESRVTVEIANAAELEQAYFLSADDSILKDNAWSGESEGTYFLRFWLSNAKDPNNYVQKDLHIALRVVSTVSESPAEVRLLSSGGEYIGKPKPITKGTLFWRQYGDGYLYSFYNEAGEELCWTLKGGELSQTEMCLTVTGGTEGAVFSLMTAQAAKQ